MNGQYTNDEAIVFNDGFVRVVISNWTDVKLADKNTIHAAAIADGFTLDPNVG